MIKNPKETNIIKRLILHFNIDKTIVMKDHLDHKNIEYTVNL